MAEKCSERIPESGGLSHHQCSRHGTVFDENRWWCKQHSPAEKAARRREQQEKDQTQYDQRRRDRTLETYNQAAGDYCRKLGLTVEQLATLLEA